MLFCKDVYPYCLCLVQKVKPEVIGVETLMSTASHWHKLVRELNSYWLPGNATNLWVQQTFGNTN